MSKVHISRSYLHKTEYDYPIYCYWQDDDSIHDYYARITDTSWTEIHFEFSTTYKEEHHNEGTPVPEWMLNRLCTEEQWNRAVEDFKDSNIF